MSRAIRDMRSNTVTGKAANTGLKGEDTVIAGDSPHAAGRRAAAAWTRTIRQARQGLKHDDLTRIDLIYIFYTD
ncbi:hypothetical protein GCM10008171_12220 [Methylopila jiangsuensis]|uniref:Uncharacterized protein n=1 Tax=Methylopila jiangsuensis TaxID=586230 RepID=A0A9W6JI54_9HYPH|nr:hypothetical protein GCM10008171_12220 [Methylopila jiangsuensis]